VIAAAALGLAGASSAPAALAVGDHSSSTQLTSASSSSMVSSQHALPLIPDCTSAPTPEVPGRGVVGFFQSPPKTLPPDADPFAPNAKVSIYEVYGYAGLRWNTYDLGCGPDLARAPDAAIGTAVANWVFELPKTAVAATGAVVGAAFSPDFLGVFDPLISNVVDTLRHTVFEQWAFVVIGALGLLLIWRARHASLASSAAAVGWALIVMVLVTMVFRWPLVAGHAADETVTSTLAAVTGGLNGKAPGAATDAGTEATAGMQESLLYQSWLGGTFGSTDSDVAKKYGPVIFDATALTWRQAQILESDPKQGQQIIKDKEKKFESAAKAIKAEDPDAYEYLTGKRSDSRVGYALLAGLATLCAVPFLFIAALLVLGALIIVRFGVMLFPAFATLGLFPTMRTLVTGIGSTVAAALINAVVFGIGAGITILGMGVLLSPSAGTPPWLDIVLMLLLTIVMWVALRPFRRLTQMVSSRSNHFAAASGGVSTVTRSAAKTSGRILTGALSTFLGVSAAQRNGAAELAAAQATDGVPQRAEANGTYQPYVVTAEGAAPVAAPAEAGIGLGTVAASAGAGVGGGSLAPAAAGPATLGGNLQINAGSVTVVGASTAGGANGDIFAPTAAGGAGARSENRVGANGSAHVVDGAYDGDGPVNPGRSETSSAGAANHSDGSPWVAAGGGRGRPRVMTGGPPVPVGADGWTPQADGAPVVRATDRGFQRPEGAPAESFDVEDLDEVFRPDPARRP
jgi:membrane protein implicated in regulation of membrane protease activity